tara:strand:- start:203 stop:985 length:783 start_codon:yes stop_codon:yes gene_type:complete
MAHYSLFIPHVQGANPEHLARVGLGSLNADGAPEFGDATGPEGTKGVFGTWRDHSQASIFHPHFGYDESRQTWTPCAVDESIGLKKGDFWIGMEPDNPVTPDDLRRPNQQLGYEIELGDGNTWTIPRVTALPTTLGIDLDSGKIKGSTTKPFADFSERTWAYASTIFDQLGMLHKLQQQKPDLAVKQNVEFALEDTFKHACDALAINYRLHWQIINALPVPLFTEANTVQCLLAMIDYHEIMEVREQKKNSTVTVIIEIG